MPQRSLPSPIGLIRLHGDGACLTRLHIAPDPAEADTGDDALLDEAAAQITAYFAGRLFRFDLPLAPSPSARGAALREAICAIAPGHTASYGALARRAGSGPRAIGQACARNPLPIIVPCHRVVASQGLGHYSAGAGAATKQWLLDHEGHSADAI